MVWPLLALKSWSAANCLAVVGIRGAYALTAEFAAASVVNKVACFESDGVEAADTTLAGVCATGGRPAAVTLISAEAGLLSVSGDTNDAQKESAAGAGMDAETALALTNP